MWSGRLAGDAVGLVLRFWRRTLRTQVRGLEWFDRYPCSVLAVWHGRMQGPLFSIADRGVLTMASLSLDGEIAARAVARLGLTATRGSTGKGGRKALDEMRQQLLEGRGKIAGLTVDGPRGPMRQARRGVIKLARDLDAPIIPASFSSRPHWRLRSWDRLLLAPPLGKVIVAFGPPMWVAHDEPSKAACARLNAILDTMTEDLDHELHGRSLW